MIDEVEETLSFKISEGDGTSNYNDLSNKPSINGVEVSGKLTSDDLGLQAKGDYALSSDLDTKVDKEEGKGLSENNFTNADKSKLDSLHNYDDTTLREYINTHDDLIYANSKAYTDTVISDIEVPTKTSQLTNDSGFITSIPSEYVTESELNAKGYATDSSVTTKLSAKQDKLTAGDNITIVGNVISASGGSSEVTKSYVDTQDTATLTSAKSYTDTKVATKQDTLVAGANITITGNTISATSSGGVTKDYVDTQDATTLASAKAYADTKAYDDTNIKKLIDSNADYIMSIDQSTQMKLENVQMVLANKADANDVQSLQMDISNLQNDLIDKASFDDVQSLQTDVINIQNDLMGKANESDVYNKGEINFKLSSKQNVLTAGTNITIKNDVISASGGTSYDDTDVRGLISANTTAITNKADKTSVPTKVSQLTNDSGYITSVPDTYADKTYVANEDIKTLSSAKAYADTKASASSVYTKTEIDSMIGDIESALSSIIGG